MKKIVVITGASSGIGRQTALDLANQGVQVIGAARTIENDQALSNHQNITTMNLDITSHASIAHFVTAISNQYSHVDGLVNAAGYGAFGALEEVPLAEARNQLDVNLLGIVDLIQVILPLIRKSADGRIINISSLAGQSYSALAGWYYISKHALETMSDVLRLELKQFNIKVVIVEPGITNTNWARITIDKMLSVTPKSSPYRQMAERQAQLITKPTQTTADVSRTIIKAMSAKRPKNRYQVRFMDRIAMKSIHLLSYALQDRLAERMMR